MHAQHILWQLATRAMYLGWAVYQELMTAYGIASAMVEILEHTNGILRPENYFTDALRLGMKLEELENMEWSQE